MQILTNKAKATAVMTIVLLMASVALMAMPVNAQDETGEGAHGGTPGAPQWGPLPAGVTPDVTVVTYAFLSVTPNPIGVGQPALVNVWVTPSINVASYRTGYTVTITKPDNTTDVVGPMNSYYGDSTTWFQYVVDQVGTWKFKFDSPGDYYPAGMYGGTYWGGGSGQPAVNITKSRWYKPCSSPVSELVVQSEMVASWPSSALPTDYWTRPISPENREWWVIGGNYPWSGSGEGFPDWPAGTNYFQGNTKYNAWVTAPNTAHIVWKRQGALGGIIGGETGTMIVGSGEGTYGNTPSIIFLGRAYQTLTKPVDGVPTSVWECYDIRTGEVYWDLVNVTAPTNIEVNFRVPVIPGATESSAGVAAPTLDSIGARLIKYNAFTGAMTLNVTGMPGTLIGNYVISMQTNNTAIGNRLINWTISGTSTNFTARIVENRSVAFSSIAANVDWQAGVFGTMTSITGTNNAPIGCRIVGYDIKTGQMTCNVTDDQVPYTTSEVGVDHGKIACLMQNGYAAAYDLRTGKRAWISQQTYSVGGYPWGIWGAYSSASYGGNYILSLYDGIYAFDWETGKISWVYRAPSVPFETPYGGWVSFNAGVVIADGKIYVGNAEHSPTTPLTRGWKLHCINATTGKGIWNVSGGMSPGAMADGYLTATNRYDGYMYVFGKGKSATTVTATPAVIAKGSTALIQGTVSDQSPGQPGTPCVSAASMETQMEYLHMQHPIDGIWHNETMTGVPVILTAIGSDGTVIDIGTTTTNAYYGTFGYAWTPPKEDTYTIMASFAGDDSYGSSSAATGLSVGPAPASPTPTPTEQPQAAPDNTPLIYATVAIIVAIAVVGIMLYRKRP